MAFGATSNSPQWNPAADLNSDGIIDVLDLVIVIINFGSVIPEYPSYAVLSLFMIASTAIAVAVFREKYAVAPKSET